MSSAPWFWTTSSSSCSPSISSLNPCRNKKEFLIHSHCHSWSSVVYFECLIWPPQTPAAVWPLKDQLQVPPVLLVGLGCLWRWQGEHSGRTRTCLPGPLHPAASPLAPPVRPGCHSKGTPSGPVCLVQLGRQKKSHKGQVKLIYGRAVNNIGDGIQTWLLYCGFRGNKSHSFQIYEKSLVLWHFLIHKTDWYSRWTHT